jgi:hypothetical protein
VLSLPLLLGTAVAAVFVALTRRTSMEKSWQSEKRRKKDNAKGKNNWHARH